MNAKDADKKTRGSIEYFEQGGYEKTDLEQALDFISLAAANGHFHIVLEIFNGVVIDALKELGYTLITNHEMKRLACYHVSWDV